MLSLRHTIRRPLSHSPPLRRTNISPFHTHAPTRPTLLSKPLFPSTQEHTLLSLSRTPTLTTTNPATHAHNTSSSSALFRLGTIGATLIQVRGGKRNTYNPSIIVRKRRHGFLARLRSRTGRKILKRRRERGRVRLSH